MSLYEKVIALRKEMKVDDPGMTDPWEIVFFYAPLRREQARRGR
jgi:hypothetical protein